MHVCVSWRITGDDTGLVGIALDCYHRLPVFSDIQLWRIFSSLSTERTTDKEMIKIVCVYMLSRSKSAYMGKSACVKQYLCMFFFVFFLRITAAIGWQPTSEAIGKRERCICDTFVGSAIATGLDEETSAPGSHD